MLSRNIFVLTAITSEDYVYTSVIVPINTRAH